MSRSRVGRITVVAPDLAGGGVTRAWLLARVIRHLGHAVDVVGTRRGDALRYPPPPGIDVRAVPIGAGWPLPARRLVSAIRGEVVVAVKPRLDSYGVALAARRARGTPVLLDIDDWELSWHARQPGEGRARHLMRAARSASALRHPDAPPWGWAMERLVGRADAITCASVPLVARYGGSVLPNGVDTALFDPARHARDALRAALGFDGLRVLAFCGVARPHKGVQDLLAALDLLDRPDLRLVLVGHNPYDDYDDRLARRWPRWVTRLPTRAVGEVAQVLAAADLVALPQRDTPTGRYQSPMKLVEAMAMARPILTTTVGPIPDVVGDTAWMAPPGDPRALAGRLADLLDDPREAATRGAAARARCVSRFGLDALAGHLGPVLDRLLARGGRGPERVVRPHAP